MRNPFDSIRKVDEIHSPMLFLHSPEDSVIPIAEGRRLYDAARAEKTFVEVHGGHVNAADEDPERFFGAIRAFLAQHQLIAARAGSDQGRIGSME
jgi:pimeloyl-ACP methyl ester carboxylesterase